MHRLMISLCLVLLLLTQAAAVTIETAHSQFFNEEEIRPISQYFGSALGKQRFRTVVASDPGNPAGHYFVAKLTDHGGNAPASARLTCLPSDRKKELEHTWNLAGKELKGWLYLGLTGGDWPDPEVQPMAWRLELLGDDGSVLAEWKSFLWEMP
jgi:hypothetical protein